MHRLACIELPSFPLQLLLRKRPEWRAYPCAVVLEDKAQGKLSFVNEKARAKGILPGQSHAQALSLASDLHADVVSDKEVNESIAAIDKLLLDFSPQVDSSMAGNVGKKTLGAKSPGKKTTHDMHSAQSALGGVFWCDATGLSGLFPNLRKWGQDIRRRLREQGFVSTVVIGHRRFTTYALARASKPGLLFFESAEEEERQAHSVLLDRLDFDPKVRDTLAKLGVVSLGEFCALPAEALGTRFGHELYALHALAQGRAWDPLHTERAPEAVRSTIDIEPPERDSTRLIFAIKRPLDELLAELASRKRALTLLFVRLSLDHSDQVVSEQIRPAQPTLESRLLLSLLQVRLESSPPPLAVCEVHLSAQEVIATREQLRLFAGNGALGAPKRDLRAANEAFARIRADLGNQCIVRAVLRDAHLPEARFAYQPLHELQAAAVVESEQARPSLVRRIYHRPIQVQASMHYDPQHLVMRGETLEALAGPYILAGGWWNRAIHRDYYYVENQRGDLLWIYYDRKRQSWFVQGRVE